MNQVTLAGKITQGHNGNEAIVMKTDSKNNPVAEFNLCVSEYYNKEWQKHFFKVKVYGPTAEMVEKHCDAGSKIVVMGKLMQPRWKDNEGKARSSVIIVTFKVGFLDLDKTEQQDYEQSTDDMY